MDRALQHEQVHVQVQQVAAGEGTRATDERRERRARGGNRRGAERWRLRELAMPAAVGAIANTPATPMLSEDTERDGGAAPRKRPWMGRSEAPGRRRRVAVVRLASSPPLPTSFGPPRRHGSCNPF